MTLFSRIGALIQINVNFVANFFITPLVVAVRDKASLKIACIGNSVLGERQGTI